MTGQERSSSSTAPVSACAGLRHLGIHRRVVVAMRNLKEIVNLACLIIGAVGQAAGRM